MPLTCIAVGCGSRSNRDNVKFYCVPALTNHKFLTNKNELSRKRREMWLAAIKRDDLTEAKIKNQRVCSQHFITGGSTKIYFIHCFQYSFYLRQTRGSRR